MSKTIEGLFQENTFHCAMQVSNLQLAASTDEVKHSVHHRMRHQMADALVHKKMVETRHAFSTEFRMSVLVLTPDEFYHAVQLAAMELESRRPVPMPVQF